MGLTAYPYHSFDDGEHLVAGGSCVLCWRMNFVS
jgi:hypothetical protein